MDIVFVSAEVAPWSKIGGALPSPPAAVQSHERSGRLAAVGARDASHSGSASDSPLTRSSPPPPLHTGGLGDVVGGLPIELAKRGHRVISIAPRYDQYADGWDTSVTINVMGEEVRIRSRSPHPPSHPRSASRRPFCPAAAASTPPPPPRRPPAQLCRLGRPGGAAGRAWPAGQRSRTRLHAGRPRCATSTPSRRACTACSWTTPCSWPRCAALPGCLRRSSLRPPPPPLPPCAPPGARRLPGGAAAAQPTSPPPPCGRRCLARRAPCCTAPSRAPTSRTTTSASPCSAGARAGRQPRAAAGAGGLVRPAARGRAQRARAPPRSCAGGA
jgi:hypothetical protein